MTSFDRSTHSSLGLIPLAPERLHGREHATAQILEALGRVREGGGELILISGPAGIGKSALAESLQKPVQAGGGVFARGWFDPMQRAPYAALRRGIGHAIAQLLDGDTEGADVGPTIAAALGDGAGVIAEIVPQITALIGDVPSPAPVSPAEEQNRFRLMIERVLGALARDASPLVVLLDDLQWADESSIDLLSELVARGGLDGVLLLGAVRVEGKNERHPLLQLVGPSEDGCLPVMRIALEPLDSRASAALVADALGLPEDRVVPLADAARDAAKGIPLELLRFLGVLHDGGVLRREEDGGWTWDMERTEVLALERGAAALLENVMRRLPAPTVEALEVAACLAGEFSAEFLAAGQGARPTDAVIALAPALDKSILRPVSGPTSLGVAPTGEHASLSYRFVHDRIRDAIYQRIPPADRGRTHLEIARRLMSTLRIQPATRLLFDAAEQLQRATELGALGGDRPAVARLYAQAGRAANRTAAWSQGVSYLEAGLKALGDPPQDPALNGPIHLLLAEAYPMCGRLEDGERSLTEAEATAPDLSASVEIARRRTRILTHANRYEDAVRAGLAGLALVAEELPPLDDIEAWSGPTQREVVRMAELMSDIGLDQLLDRPPMTDERSSHELALLSALMAPAYLYPHVLGWTVTRMVNLCLEWGNGDQAPIAYAMQGFLCCVGGDVEVGQSLGRVAMDLVERHEHRALAAPVIHLYVNYVDHFVHPLRDGIPLGLAAIDKALEHGLFDYAGWLAMNAVNNSFCCGEPLPGLVERTVSLFRMAKGTARYEDAATFVEGMLHVVASLAGRTDLVRQIERSGSSAAVAAERLTHYPVASVVLTTSRLLAACLMGELEAARPLAATVRGGLAAAMGMPTHTDFAICESLLLSDEYGNAEPDRRAEIEGQLEQHREQLEIVASHCPANFRHKQWLVTAELAALRGENADRSFERAARDAASAGAHHAEALAWERCTVHRRQRGENGAADDSLVLAFRAYRRWGAKAKLAQLRTLASGAGDG